MNLHPELQANQFTNHTHSWIQLQHPDSNSGVVSNTPLQCIACKTLKFELEDSSIVYKVGFNGQWARFNPVCIEDLTNH